MWARHGDRGGEDRQLDGEGGPPTPQRPPKPAESRRYPMRGNQWSPGRGEAGTGRWLRRDSTSRKAGKCPVRRGCKAGHLVSRVCGWMRGGDRGGTWEATPPPPQVRPSLPPGLGSVTPPSPSDKRPPRLRVRPDLGRPALLNVLVGVPSLYLQLHGPRASGLGATPETCQPEPGSGEAAPHWGLLP